MEVSCSNTITSTKGKDIKEYTSHFYANACHICKQYGKPLIYCEKCKIIGYCREEHKRLHEIEHKYVCDIITSIVAEERNIIPRSTGNFQNTENWNKRRKDIYVSVQSRMTRALYADEQEMLIFPRSCMVCHDQGDFLHACYNCPNFNLCENHVTTNARLNHHCESFVLCYEVDTRGGLPCLNYFRHLPTKILYHHNIQENGCVNFFSSYIKPFLKGNADDIQLAIHSQCITQPLTLLHAAKLINFDFNHRELCIHIIDCNTNQDNVMDTWEILFHYEPMLKVINIIIIGRYAADLFDPNHDLCPTCASDGKKLLFTFYNTNYYKYFYSIPDFRKPHIVVAYNPSIYVLRTPLNTVDVLEHKRYAVWMVIIRFLLQYSNCPLILTSCTADKAKKNAEAINSIAKQCIMRHSIAKLNPFASLRPYRDPETELPIFQNSFLTIYENPTLQYQSPC